MKRNVKRKRQINCAGWQLQLPRPGVHLAGTIGAHPSSGAASLELQDVEEHTVALAQRTLLRPRTGALRADRALWLCLQDALVLIFALLGCLLGRMQNI